MALGRGQTTEVGAYANQRLNLAKLGRPLEEMPWFRTGPGKTGRPGLSGGPAKRSYGGIVNPPCNRKGKCGNPSPTAGARGFYPNHEIRGTQLNGGEAQNLVPGDVIVVPAGMPHWFKEVQAPFLYYTVKVQ